MGHVALKPPKVGHSSTNPSNMQYELLITQYDNNHDEINKQAIDIFRIVPQWYGVSVAGWNECINNVVIKNVVIKLKLIGRDFELVLSFKVS